MMTTFIWSAALMLVLFAQPLTVQAQETSSPGLNSLTMKKNYYTHALWHVKEGRTEEFIAAWKRFGIALSEMPNSPSLEGTLIQSLDDPLVFYSFGPWENLEDITAMRNDDQVKKALAEIVALCQAAKPGSYKAVLQVSFPAKKDQ